MTQPDGADHRDHGWQNMVADAISESNPERLHDKITAAEAAIFERLQSLASDSHSQSTEVFELHKASEALLALKTNILKFPHWRQS